MGAVGSVFLLGWNSTQSDRIAQTALDRVVAAHRDIMEGV